MPRNQPTQVTDEWDGGRPAKHRKVARYAVPVAVAGVAAATIGLVPAFAGSSDPDLPKISAQDLIAKIADSKVEQLSGTVKVSTDLGLPSLPGGAGAGMFGGGDGKGHGGGKGSGATAPQDKLMELASGTHTLRVAADGPDKQRISLVEKSAEYSLIHNGGEVWGYDSGSNTVFHAKAPADAGKGAKDSKKQLPQDLKNATPQELAKKALDAAGDTTSVAVDGTAKVAGRDAYQLTVKPKQSGSTVGAIRIAVDAQNGVPLKFTLTPKSGGAAAIDVGFTSVDFAKPDAGTFAFTPPKGAKVVEGDELRTQGSGKGHDGSKGRDFLGGAGLAGSGMKVIGEGWTSIATVKGTGAAGLTGGSPAKGKGGQESLPPEAEKLLDSFGDAVEGRFGSGRVFSTRLVNALLTDDGTVYVGAVDKQSLINAANAAGTAK